MNLVSIVSFCLLLSVGAKEYSIKDDIEKKVYLEITGNLTRNINLKTKTLMFTKTDNNETLFLELIRNGHIETLRYTFERAVAEDGSKEMVTNILNEKDSRGNNALNLAIDQESTTMFEYLFKFFTDNVITVDEMLNVKDEHGNNFLLKSASTVDPQVIDCVIGKLEDAGLELDDLFNERDDSGKNLMLIAVNRGNRDTVQRLLQCTCNWYVKKEDTMKMLVEIRDKGGNNCLHTAVRNDSTLILEDLLSALRARSIDTKVLLSAKNNRGYNVLLEAAYWGHSKVIFHLLDYLIDQGLTTQIIHRNVDPNEENIVMVCTARCDPGTLRRVLQYILDKSGRPPYFLLRYVNRHNDNILTIAARDGNLSNLKCVLEFFKEKEISVEYLLDHKDEWGYNFFVKAAYWHHKEMVNFLLVYLELEGLDVKSVLGKHYDQLYDFLRYDTDYFKRP